MKPLPVLLSLLLLCSGCALQKAEQSAGEACAQQGKRAFIADVRAARLTAVVVEAHARYLCVGPGETARLPPPLDAEVVLFTNLGGVGILSVAPGSLAERMGLKANDIVQTVGDKAVARPADLQWALTQGAPGSEATLQVRRAGRSTTLSARF